LKRLTDTLSALTVMTKTIPKIILASGSPRRRELLSSLGLEFEIDPGDIDESLRRGEAPADYIIRLARAKVIDAAARHAQGLVLGADTTVVVEDQILAKPEDDQDGRRMLRLLSGRWHSVMTGVAICDIEAGREAFDYAETRVRFAEMDEREIDWYVSTGEHRDKAGAYAIQGRGSLFVEEIEGNYHNVVGLPVRLVYRLMMELGYSLIRG
jgi:septum formation protein